MNFSRKVLLLSSSPLKLEALIASTADFGVSIEAVVQQAVSVPFNPEQPIEPYGLVCACMRVQHAEFSRDSCRWVVAIENSLLLNYPEQKAYDVVNAVLLDLRNELRFAEKCAHPIEMPWEAAMEAKNKSGDAVTPYGWSLTGGQFANPHGGNPKDWSGKRVQQIADTLKPLWERVYHCNPDGEHDMQACVRYIPNFPKPGILFQDISPLFANVLALDRFCKKVLYTLNDSPVNYVVGLESRGFTLAGLLAGKKGWPMLLIRKAGKLPPPVLSVQYNTEYSRDTLELSTFGVMTPKVDTPPLHFLIVDDLVATGGSLGAAIDLIRMVYPDARITCFAVTCVPELRAQADRVITQERGVPLVTVF